MPKKFPEFSTHTFENHQLKGILPSNPSGEKSIKSTERNHLKLIDTRTFFNSRDILVITAGFTFKTKEMKNKQLDFCIFASTPNTEEYLLSQIQSVVTSDFFHPINVSAVFLMEEDASLDFGLILHKHDKKNAAAIRNLYMNVIWYSGK